MEDKQLFSLIVIIVEICEVLKLAGVPSRFMPLLAVVLGIAGSLLFFQVNFLYATAGVIIGLSTTGGYALVKTSILNK